MPRTRYWISYIGQVQSGAYAHGIGEFGGRSSMSTYSSMEDLLAKHAGEIIDGAWIVDARAVPLDDAATESVCGPMDNAMLAPHDDEGSGAMDYVSEKTKAWRWAQLGATVLRWSAGKGIPEPHDWEGWVPPVPAAAVIRRAAMEVA